MFGKQGETSDLRIATWTAVLNAYSFTHLIDKKRRKELPRVQETDEGVNPSKNPTGGVAERSMAADCKSADECLRRFESYSLHHFEMVFQDARLSQTNRTFRNPTFPEQNFRRP